jgi:hypothetical protein
MTAPIRFSPGERAAVDAAHEAARAAAEASGLSLPGNGAVHAMLHRDLIRRARSDTGRRPRHAEVAASLLEWSRGLGRVELFGLCPFAHALAEDHGRAGLDLAALHLPALSEALGLCAEIPAPLTRRSAAKRTEAGSGAATGPHVDAPAFPAFQATAGESSTSVPA